MTKVIRDTKLLQAIINRLTLMDKKIDDGFGENKKDHEKINKRLDMIGSQVAYLEDDAPTQEEHDELDKRVGKIEKQISLS